MRKIKRLLSAALVFCIFASMLTSCGGAAGSDAAASGDAASSNVNPAKREKITILLGDSGIPTPSTVDINDNKFINIVENYANADIEITQPAYADFATKFNLTMSSGELPDIIHTWFVDDAIKYGDQGAFLDLKSYYDKSEVIQKIISPEAMELTKTDSGHYYRIPQGTTGYKQGNGNWIRYDLLKEYNGGEFPKDVQGYVDFLYWVKKTYPDSIPLSARNNDTKIFLYGETFFKWYGAMPQSYNVIDGKVVSTFILPEYREAVELYRQLYKDDILDKEFASQPADVYYAKMDANKLALSTDVPLSLQTNNGNKAANEETKDDFKVFTPDLETYPKVVRDPIYTQAFKQPPVGIHGFYISSTCKNPELAFKVIEGFASDALTDMVTWGEEGVEYTVADGKKIPDAEKLAADEHRFGTHMMVVQGFGAAVPAQDVIAESRMGAEKWAAHQESIARIAAEADKRGYALIDVFRYTAGLLKEPDEVKEKKAEFDKFTAEATVNAITGQISMEQFDQLVEEYKTRYGFVDEAWTKLVTENKDFLLSVGCLEAGR